MELKDQFCYDFVYACQGGAQANIEFITHDSTSTFSVSLKQNNKVYQWQTFRLQRKIEKAGRYKIELKTTHSLFYLREITKCSAIGTGKRYYICLTFEMMLLILLISD
jgi:hypothetical protein